jgi:hypothetical protein
MARYSTGAKTTSGGSTSLPLLSLYAGANAGGTLRGVSITNTTSSAWDAKLVRLTSTGTQGAGLTEARHNTNALATSNCGGFNTHSANPSLGDDLGYRWTIGAAVGAGVIETFGDAGIVIPVGVANGIGVIVENGVGAISQIYFVWDE